MGGADKKSRVLTILLFSASITLFIQLWSKGKVINNLRVNLAVTQRELRQSTQQLRRRNAELTKVANDLKKAAQESKNMKRDLDMERSKKGGCESCQEEKDSLEKKYMESMASLAQEKQEVEQQLNKEETDNKDLHAKIITLKDLQEKDEKVIQVLKSSLSKLDLDETLRNVLKEKHTDSQEKNEDEEKSSSLKIADEDTFKELSGHSNQKDFEEEITSNEKKEREEVEYSEEQNEDNSITAAEEKNIIKDRSRIGFGRVPEEEEERLTGGSNEQQNQPIVRRRKGHLVKRKRRRYINI